MLPPLLFAILISFRPARVFKITTLMQVVLAFVFMQALLVGWKNLVYEGEPRAYFSHLFQILSAFIMFGVGLNIKRSLDFNFWRLHVILALIATYIATFFTLRALDANLIGRLYTPAFGFILVAAFSAVYSSRISLVAFVGVLVSNKRGVIVAVMLVYIARFFFDLVNKNSGAVVGKIKIVFSGVLLFSIIIIVSLVAVEKAQEDGADGSAVSRAIFLTSDRMIKTVEGLYNNDELANVDRGRADEIDTVLSEMDGLNWVFGNGAGWKTVLPNGSVIQNIHFSPLSLAAVFGAPFSFFIYAYSFCCISIFFLKRRDSEDVTVSMAPLYLVGALAHSLIAYSLFIDLLFFLFLGVLVSSLKEGERSNA